VPPALNFVVSFSAVNVQNLSRNYSRDALRLKDADARRGTPPIILTTKRRDSLRALHPQRSVAHANICEIGSNEINDRLLPIWFASNAIRTAESRKILVTAVDGGGRVGVRPAGATPGARHCRRAGIALRRQLAANCTGVSGGGSPIGDGSGGAGG
jgi:hypothetical protein